MKHSLIALAFLAAATPHLAFADDACSPKLVDAAGVVAPSEACVGFDAERHLGPGWKKNGGGLRGMRIIFGMSSLEKVGAPSAGDSDPPRLYVALGKKGSSKSTELLGWSPKGGVSKVDEVLLSADGHLVAVLFAPSPTGGQPPETVKPVAAIFDVRKRLAVIAK